MGVVGELAPEPRRLPVGGEELRRPDRLERARKSRFAR
jgi:hypothetical protein